MSATSSPRRRSPAGSFAPRGLHELLEIPLRRPVHVLAPIVVSIAVAIGLGFVLPTMYRSSTLVLVEAERIPDAFVQKMATETLVRRAQTIRQEILSRTRLERVIGELDPYPARDGVPASLSVQVERMRRAISIETKASDAFLIQFQHTDPEMAMKVTDRVARLFIEEAEKERDKQATDGYEFIDSQLSEVRAELERRERAVRAFKEQNLGSLPEQLGTNLSTLQRLQQEQQTVTESLRAARSRLDSLRQGFEQPGSTGAPGNPDVELAQLRSQLGTLRVRYTDEHPEVRALTARILRLEEAQAAVTPVADAGRVSPRAQIREVEAEIQTLEVKKADLEARMGLIQNRVDRVPRTEQELATLSRDYSQLEGTYAALLKKQMDARMAAEAEQRWQGERFKVLDPANLPDRPYFPNLVLLGIGGLVLGSVAGLGMAVAAEYLDHSIKSADQLEALLGTPALATIPLIRSANRRTRDAA